MSLKLINSNIFLRLLLLIVFIFIIISANNLYANAVIKSGYFKLDGYKNIKFGMDTNTVHNLVSKAAATSGNEIYAEFIETLKLRETNEALKYYDVQFKLIYIFFFENNQLYRIDIATHSGQSYDNADIENPVSASYIDSLVDSIKVSFGAITKHDREYFDYKNKDFAIDTYLWLSPLTSVSLVVKPTTKSYDKILKYYTYRLTYYNDMLLKQISKY